MRRRLGERCEYRARQERGSVTAEFAAVVPAVLLVLAFCLGGFQLATQRAQLQDVAATFARGAARGDAVDADRIIPGARVTTERRGNLVCARVSREVGIRAGAGGAGIFGAVTLSATSCTLSEGR